MARNTTESSMSQLTSFDELDALSLIRHLNETDEHSRCEAKTSRQVGRSLLETVCAFSNEPRLGGGFILLGVALKEKSLFPSYEFVGIDNPSKLQDEIASRCRTAFNRPIRPKMKVEAVGNQNAIVMFVPELADTEKPLYFSEEGIPRGAYRRTGSADQRCSEDDMVLFYGNHKSETFDRQVIEDATLDDIDPAAIVTYREMRRRMKPDAEELSWTDEDLLQATSCARQSGGKLKPTVAGVLLFGKRQAIRRFFPMTRVDYVRIAGTQWVENVDERFQTITVQEPLILAIQRLREVVIGDLPRVFSLPAGEFQRKEEPVLPDKVVREVVVNAIMHRCYRIHGPVQIIRYSNRIEIRNPGHSLLSSEHFGEAGSQTRNPAIAAILYDVGYAENKGSGIRVMQRLMQQSMLPPPVFESNRESNQFVAYLMMHHLLTEEDMKWLGLFAEFELTREEQVALIVARELGAIDNATYRSINGADTLNASSHLRRLRDFGILDLRGKGNKTHYRLNENFQFGVVERGGASPIKGGVPGLKGGVSDAKGGAPGKNGGLVHKESEESEDWEVFAEIPEEVRARLPRIGKRASRDDLRRAILELCAWRPLMPSELASYLGRKSVKRVVEEYISPMCADGLLLRTKPENPTHPGQQYRTSSSGIAHIL